MTQEGGGRAWAPPAVQRSLEYVARSHSAFLELIANQTTQLIAENKRENLQDWAVQRLLSMWRAGTGTWAKSKEILIVEFGSGYLHSNGRGHNTGDSGDTHNGHRVDRGQRADKGDTFFKKF